MKPVLAYSFSKALTTALLGGLIVSLPVSAQSSALAPAPQEQTDASEPVFGPLFAANPIFQDGLTAFQTLDGRSFRLERRGNLTLFQQDGQTEVWALETVPGPRGDEFLKNDVGRLFVRLTDLGGVILYSASHPQGMPVDPIAEPEAIDRPRFNADMSNSLTLYLSLRTGHPISVSIEDLDHHTARWLQDAARIAGESLVGNPDEAADIHRLEVRTGSVPELDLSDEGTLIVYVNPDDRFEGRPSSDRVTIFLKNRMAS